MNFWIYNNGTKLSDDEQESGRAAAMTVFESANADPLECFEAQQEINAFDASEGGTIASNVQMRAVIWGEAENAAIIAATNGWVRTPEDLSLGMA